MKNLKTSLLLLLVTTLITLGALLLTKPAFTQSELPDIWGSNLVNGIIIHSNNLQPGDIVFAYFEHEGEKYIAGKQKIENWIWILKGFGFSAHIEGPNVLDGIPAGYVIHLGVKKGDNLYRMESDSIVGMMGTVFDEMICQSGLFIFKCYGVNPVEEISGIKQVPYVDVFYSQCPEIDLTLIDAGEVAVGDEIIIHRFKPRHVKSFEFDLISGSGEIFRDGLYTWRYKVGKEDPVNGEVNIRVNTVPYYGCNEDQVVFNCKIKMKKPDAGGFADITKRQWYTLVKYYLEFTFEDGIAKLCYNKQRKHWKDKPIPPLKYEFFTATSKYARYKLTETRMVKDECPCESFSLPKSAVKGYLKVTTIDHGYTWQWRFSKL